MTPDELGNMDNSMCVVQIRGLDPFLDNKFDYLAHPNYEHTSDADPSLSYQNLIDNMAETSMPSDADIAMYQTSQAQSIYKICSLEDMIKNNPAWSDYPGIFSQFKSVEPADDTETAIKELAQAIKVTQQSVPTSPEDNVLDATPSPQTSPSTIADIIEEYDKNGGDVQQMLSTAKCDVGNFFDDEDV
jgi:hypothetical protein